GSDGLNQQALDPRRKRGRPPRVDNPMEMRIKNVLKGIRRVKDENNVSKIKGFDKLPDQKQHPGYYTRIANPISVEGIKKKIKRREYEVLNDFINDLRLMFQNTRQYYDQNHILYKDSLILEDEAAKLAQTEMAKSEIQLGEEMFSAAGDRNVKDKRFPVSKIDHKGESYTLGDWIHLVNPNDPAKPTVGQIFRTWRTENGSFWINACWYYRPEQTVHSVYRKFFDREVFKTGQYRDHQIEEVLGKCFVMFVTKYSRGRPKGFQNKPVYVCESRYNELEKKLNKIKTWKSCIPDEIRSRDYEMDMFPQPQPLIKVESPIKHLLPKDAKEGDPLPEATMGAENAPPIVGAVFLGEKEVCRRCFAFLSSLQHFFVFFFLTLSSYRKLHHLKSPLHHLQSTIPLAHLARRALNPEPPTITRTCL
ncbi:BAH-domain-containing protein, partial [Ascobolus immersus RN42]